MEPAIEDRIKDEIFKDIYLTDFPANLVDDFNDNYKIKISIFSERKIN